MSSLCTSPSPESLYFIVISLEDMHHSFDRLFVVTSGESW